LLYSNLGKLPASSVTVIIDACFSGSVPDSGGRIGSLLHNVSPLVVSTGTEDLPQNMTVVSAAGAGQVATWYPEKRHSTFTYYLLKGLKRGADANSDGSITLGELRTFVSDSVPPAALALYGREQTPEFRGSADAVLLRMK
jgi:uncharacterized caspase-like protein